MINDIICFSNDHSKFNYERLKKLSNKFFKDSRIFIIENPVFASCFDFYHIYKNNNNNIWNVTPYIENNLTKEQQVERQKILLNTLIFTRNIQNYIAWYYTSTNIEIIKHLNPLLSVLDYEKNSLNQLITYKSNDNNTIKFSQNPDLIFAGEHSLLTLKQNNKNLISHIQKENKIKASMPNGKNKYHQFSMYKY